MENIKRREALKRAAFLMGGAISAPTIFGVLKGCSPKPGLDWNPTFFTEAQALSITRIAELILPETDTPGAKSLGVPAFIEEMVSLCLKPADKTRFMEGLEKFEALCSKEYGKGFVELSKDVQMELLNGLNAKITKAEVIRDQPLDLGGMEPFFWKIKELTIVGYYTSEYGATQALQYQPIPVEYNGCVPLEKAGNGKTWAT